MASIVSGVFGAVGANYQGQAQAKAYEANARLAEDEARQAEQRAVYEEALHRQRMAKLESSQRAGYAKAGVALEGSPLEAIIASATEGERDAAVIRYQGELDAWRSRSEASLNRGYAKASRTAGYIGAATSIAGGAAQHFMTPKNQSEQSYVLGSDMDPARRLRILKGDV